MPVHPTQKRPESNSESVPLWVTCPAAVACAAIAQLLEPDLTIGAYEGLKCIWRRLLSNQIRFENEASCRVLVSLQSYVSSNPFSQATCIGLPHLSGLAWLVV